MIKKTEFTRDEAVDFAFKSGIIIVPNGKIQGDTNELAVMANLILEYLKKEENDD